MSSNYRLEGPRNSHRLLRCIVYQKGVRPEVVSDQDHSKYPSWSHQYLKTAINIQQQYLLNEGLLQHMIQFDEFSVAAFVSPLAASDPLIYLHPQRSHLHCCINLRWHFL